MSRFGYHIIQSLDVPRIIKDGILHHHEQLMVLVIRVALKREKYL